MLEWSRVYQIPLRAGGAGGLRRLPQWGGGVFSKGTFKLLMRRTACFGKWRLSLQLFVLERARACHVPLIASGAGGLPWCPTLGGWLLSKAKMEKGAKPEQWAWQ